MRWLLLVVLVAACDSQAADDQPAPGECAAAPGPSSGSGTYYAADGTGSCSFDASPDDLMVAAMNAADYANAAWCGACLSVDGPNGSVIVRVVDKCPGCASGDLDLSQQAFGKLAPLAQGRIPITWREVPCDVSGPLAYHFKNGANAYWTAIQLRNHRYPIATLEAQATDGSFKKIDRVDYNYFVATAGLGAGPYTLRVTDTRGQVLTDPGITLGDSVTRQGAAQFATCP